MKIVVGAVAVVAAATQVGCFYPCTEYSEELAVEGRIVSRQSMKHVRGVYAVRVEACSKPVFEAVDAEDGGCEPAAGAPCGGEAGASAPGAWRCDPGAMPEAAVTTVEGKQIWPRWRQPGSSCIREDCLDFGVGAGVELRMRQPEVVGVYTFEELGALLCESFPTSEEFAPPEDECVPAQGRVFVSLLAPECEGDDVCTTLDATFEVDEERDPELPSLHGSMRVRAGRDDYSSTCYHGPDIPLSYGGL